MSCSFTPDGDWFVFDDTSGETLHRGFKSKAQAISWIVQRRLKARAA